MLSRCSLSYCRRSSSIVISKFWYSESKQTRVPWGYWDQQENQKSFLDTIACDFEIKEPSDWNNITRKQLKEHGGNQLLVKHGNI